ncbi:MAG: UDP-N-acetylmuramoyl-L-alanyl-D-glutamate--2,6-diaminopimelate ligase [Rickettsiales bacterium]
MSFTGVAVHSGNVKQGYAFVAIKGAKHNGENYINDAIKNGATHIIVAEDSAVTTVEGAELVRVPKIREYLSEICAQAYPLQPESIVGITGTNGKTSTAFFYKQICTLNNFKSACIGTLGVISDIGEFPHRDALTSPDAPEIHELLNKLAKSGIQRAALEVSSIGLHQHRLDHVRFKAVAFTNFTQDHLDYHGTMDDYYAAKARLFSEVIDTKTTVVLNADIPVYDKLAKICADRGIRVYSYGHQGKEFRLISNDSKMLTIDVMGRKYTTPYYLAADFQLHNTLCAVALAFCTGVQVDKAIYTLKDLHAAPGRMERIARYNGAQIFIDYAHTPDALEKALQTLKKETTGKLILVFGCGGDRDASKRVIMGAIAEKYADVVFVTDDNPRTEVAASIRKEIMAGCPKAREIFPRENAIAAAMNIISHNDILLVAGKGHENYQIIGDTKIHFSDYEQIIKHVN